MRTMPAISLMASAWLAAAPAAADNAPLRLRQFLDAHGRQDGLPTGDAATAIAPHLSAGLKAAIDAARAEQAAFMQEHPDEKPPFIEGKLFTSLAWEPLTSRSSASRSRCRMGATSPVPSVSTGSLSTFIRRSLLASTLTSSVSEG